MDMDFRVVANAFRSTSMYYFNVFQRISERRNDDAVLLIVSR